MPDARKDVIPIRDWLYRDTVGPGQRVRCQMPRCNAVLGRSRGHLLFRSLRLDDVLLPPEWVTWPCTRCGLLNVYCPTG